MHGDHPLRRTADTNRWHENNDVSRTVAPISTEQWVHEPHGETPHRGSLSIRRRLSPEFFHPVALNARSDNGRRTNLRLNRRLIIRRAKFEYTATALTRSATPVRLRARRSSAYRARRTTETVCGDADVRQPTTFIASALSPLSVVCIYRSIYLSLSGNRPLASCFCGRYATPVETCDCRPHQ